jgi:hypothetical protein
MEIVTVLSIKYGSELKTGVIIQATQDIGYMEVAVSRYATAGLSQMVEAT